MPTTRSSTDAKNIDFAALLSDEVKEVATRHCEELARLLPDQEGFAILQEEVAGAICAPQFFEAASVFYQIFQSGQMAAMLPQQDVGQAAVNAAKKADFLQFAKELTTKLEEGNDQSAKK